MARVVEVRSYQVIQVLQLAEARRLERAARIARWRARVRRLAGALPSDSTPSTEAR